MFNKALGIILHSCSKLIHTIHFLYDDIYVKQHKNLSNSTTLALRIELIII